MFAQALPPILAKIAATPVLASEMPAGFTHVKIVRLRAAAQIHMIAGVRIDFSNARETDSASYALLPSHVSLAGTTAHFNGGGFVFARAVAVGRLAIGVTSTTAAGANLCCSWRWRTFAEPRAS